MAAVAQVHAQDRVAGFQKGKVGSHIGLRTGMGLHIGILAAKKSEHSLQRKTFCLVHIFAAAIIALAGIAFRILVRQHAALGLAHRGRNEIFGSDHLQFARLAIRFLNNGCGKFRV